MLLLYTAIIAPAQVFLWEFNEEECNTFPTLYFDILVDLFFLVIFGTFRSRLIMANHDCPFQICLRQSEIVLQFCTGSLDISEKYCDDFRVISAQYLSSLSGFWFDLATSIPWSFNDLYVYQVDLAIGLA
jgi:hypothetical protein